MMLTHLRQQMTKVSTPSSLPLGLWCTGLLLPLLLLPGYTALMHAVDRDDVAGLKVLLEAGASMECKVHTHTSPDEVPTPHSCLVPTTG